MFLLNHFWRELASLVQNLPLRSGIVISAPSDRLDNLFGRTFSVKRLQEARRPFFRLRNDAIDTRFRLVHDRLAKRQIRFFVIPALPAVFLSVGPIDDLVPKVRGNSTVGLFNVGAVLDDSIPGIKVNLQTENNVLEKSRYVPFGDSVTIET